MMKLKFRNKNTQVEMGIEDKERKEHEEVRESLIMNLMKNATEAKDFDTFIALDNIRLKHRKDIQEEYDKGFMKGYKTALNGALIGTAIIGTAVGALIINKK